MKALQIAATGMQAQQLNVEVISHNIANMRTTGYKRVRPEFQDLLYQNLRQAGTTSSDAGTVLPSGIQIGMGVKTAATYRIMTQGDLVNAVRGEGFFQVQLPDGLTGYTRSGAFELDATGQIVTQEGYVVDPSITIPANAREIAINASGEVQVLVDGQTNPQNVGTLQLARFVNKSGLEAIGDNLFLETPASGTPTTGNPNSDGFGSLLQNFLEHSNVNAVSEISELIAAQRAYEMNARVISAADEMMSATSNIR